MTPISNVLGSKVRISILFGHISLVSSVAQVVCRVNSLRIRIVLAKGLFQVRTVAYSGQCSSQSLCDELIEALHEDKRSVEDGNIVYWRGYGHLGRSINRRCVFSRLYRKEV